MQGSPGREPMRTRIYVDGYNFYYGCLKGTPWKWLDLVKLFEEQILPSVFAGDASQRHQRSILTTEHCVKFFTAKIVERVARSSDSVSSQARYHTALRKVHAERVQIVEGYYAVNEMRVKLVDAETPNLPPRDCQDVLAWKVEEKQSDVNLALHAYHDAITQAVDQVVIVTNDTDLAPALQMIRTYTSARIGLVIPTRNHQRHPNTELAELADWVRNHVTAHELATCQLPRVIPGRKPTVKPDSWYAHPDLLAQILELAIPIRGSRAAVFKWMETPNLHLEGERPIELVDTAQGAHRVLDYIRGFIAEQSIVVTAETSPHKTNQIV
ncbi:antitoxin Xre/MbcA/ParS toxin-binding domain-containing protein [Pseudomonas sp. NPDC088368]|uniref:antitoxin Xre/MbcA/ParS toxin-binding domain-containing protein n=1 Tax=Pseudomonas sp. NPDC088368 TaxID=3364453 RepID=UPI0037F24E47